MTDLLTRESINLLKQRLSILEKANAELTVRVRRLEGLAGMVPSEGGIKDDDSNKADLDRPEEGPYEYDDWGGEEMLDHYPGDSQ